MMQAPRRSAFLAVALCLALLHVPSVHASWVTLYYDFKITNVDHTERVAWVTVRYTMEIPELDLPGRQFKVPKREETVQEWVWMDGDWRLVFKDLMGQPFFRY